MIETIGKIRKIRETNSSSVKEQKRIIENEIQELRTQINNHLDKLQENLMMELVEAEKQVTFDAYILMLTIFVWYLVSSFCFSSKDTSSSHVSSVTCFSASTNSIIRFSCNLSR
jgi:hypothetical protein